MWPCQLMQVISQWNPSLLNECQSSKQPDSNRKDDSASGCTVMIEPRFTAGNQTQDFSSWFKTGHTKILAKRRTGSVPLLAVSNISTGPLRRLSSIMIIMVLGCCTVLPQQKDPTDMAPCISFNYTIYIQLPCITSNWFCFMLNLKLQHQERRELCQLSSVVVVALDLWNIMLKGQFTIWQACTSASSHSDV